MMRVIIAIITGHGHHTCIYHYAGHGHTQHLLSTRCPWPHLGTKNAHVHMIGTTGMGTCPPSGHGCVSVCLAISRCTSLYMRGCVTLFRWRQARFNCRMVMGGTSSVIAFQISGDSFSLIGSIVSILQD
jgi:hypothetical protein